MIIRVLVYTLLTAFFVMLLGTFSQAASLPVELGLAQLAPGVAGLLMVLIFRRDALRISFFKQGIPVYRYLQALGIPVLVGALTLGISLVLLEKLSFNNLGAGLTALTLIWMPFGAFGEEVGWRGYLNKRLARERSGLLAAIITGVLWTPLHVHFFANGALFMLFALLFFVAASIVMHAVVVRHDFNVTLAFLFHYGINLSLALAMPVINETGFMAALALLWSVGAVFAVAVRRDLYFRQPAAASSVQPAA